jgi:uncharacterized protein (DUF4415 family)
MKMEYDFRRGKRGPVIAQTGKTRITIWIDNDVLDWFRHIAERESRGYQTTINAALREYTTKDRIPIDEVVRKAIRDELRARKAG